MEKCSWTDFRMSSKTLYLLSNQTLTLWIIDTLLSEDRFIQRSTKIDIKWATACHEIWNSETQFWKEFSFLVEIFKKHFGWKPTFHTLCHKTENLSFSLEGVTIETWSQPRRDVLRVCRNEIQSIFHFLTASSSFKMAWQRLLMQIIIQTQIISCGFMQRYQKQLKVFWTEEFLQIQNIVQKIRISVRFYYFSAMPSHFLANCWKKNGKINGSEDNSPHRTKTILMQSMFVTSLGILFTWESTRFMILFLPKIPDKKFSGRSNFETCFKKCENFWKFSNSVTKILWFLKNGRLKTLFCGWPIKSKKFLLTFCVWIIVCLVFSCVQRILSIDHKFSQQYPKIENHKNCVKDNKRFTKIKMINKRFAKMKHYDDLINGLLWKDLRQEALH